MKYITAFIIYLLPLIASAQENAVSPASGKSVSAPSGIEGLLFQLGLIFVIFYFLLIRPQQRKFKEHNKLVSSLKKGDKVITGAGFYGTIIRAGEGDRSVDVEIADGVVVKVLRSSVSELAVDKPVAKKEGK
jgi:preprotein translocase subunit YajC